MKFKKFVALILVAVCLCTCLVGCTEADNVNHNLSQAADNFQVTRKITVYNARTDMIILEMEGNMSLSNNTTNELVVTCMTGPNQYKKNYKDNSSVSAHLLFCISPVFYFFYLSLSV